MRFLLLGLGSIGRRHCSILKSLGHEVVTVDPNDAMGADYRYTPVGPVAYFQSNWQGILDCTPPDIRASWQITGPLPRFVEKPLGALPGFGAHNMAHNDVQMGFCYRFVPSLEEFIGIIKQAGVASLHIHGGQNLQDWHKEDYREVKERYHGVITDSLPHSVYIARWILGDIEYKGSAATITGAFDDLNAEDVCAVVLSGGPDEIPCLLAADYLQRPRNFQIDAVCKDGTWRQWQFAARSEIEPMYQRQMDAFVKLCAGEKVDVPTLQDGIAVQEVLDAIERP